MFSRKIKLERTMKNTCFLFALLMFSFVLVLGDAHAQSYDDSMNIPIDTEQSTEQDTEQNNEQSDEEDSEQNSEEDPDAEMVSMQKISSISQQEQYEKDITTCRIRCDPLGDVQYECTMIGGTKRECRKACRSGCNMMRKLNRPQLNEVD